MEHCGIIKAYSIPQKAIFLQAKLVMGWLIKLMHPDHLFVTGA